MAQGGWGQGPIDIGRGFTIHLPSFLQSRARMVRLVVIAMAVLVLLLTGYYQVEPDEVAVVQRFGKYVRTTDPGPHLKIPFGVETVTKVPGAAAAQDGVRLPHRAPPAIRIAVRADPRETRRRVRHAHRRPERGGGRVDRAVPDQGPAASTSSTCATCPRPSATCPRRPCARWSGDHSVDEVLTIGREAIALQAKEELQRLCDLYGIGIEVQQLVLQDVNPPDPVKPAFNEVNQAIQEKERAINEAWADYNKAVPRAKGEAEQAVRAAEGYALERVNNAEGDAKRFDALYEEYRKAPGGDAQAHLPGDDGARSCPRLGRKLVLDEKARGILPLLQLEGEAEGGEAVRPPLRCHRRGRRRSCSCCSRPSTPSPRPSR